MRRTGFEPARTDNCAVGLKPNALDHSATYAAPTNGAT